MAVSLVFYCNLLQFNLFVLSRKRFPVSSCNAVLCSALHSDFSIIISNVTLSVRTWFCYWKFTLPFWSPKYLLIIKKPMLLLLNLYLHLFSFFAVLQAVLCRVTWQTQMPWYYGDSDIMVMSLIGTLDSKKDFRVITDNYLNMRCLQCCD